jgi:GNAT superfamily N-acetyltransferase
MSPSVRVARPGEVSSVSAVLGEAAAWLESRGMPLWDDDELDPAAIAADVNAGRYVLALSGGTAVGTARVTLEDPEFWPEDTNGAGVYVHRRAVRRAHAGGGVSRALLEWAAALAQQLGRNVLRLDCDAKRPRLRAVYERFGFVYHSDRVVGPYLVARFEKRVGRRAPG